MCRDPKHHDALEGSRKWGLRTNETGRGIPALKLVDAAGAP
jgi:hypothetical protein